MLRRNEILFQIEESSLLANNRYLLGRRRQLSGGVGCTMTRRAYDVYDKEFRMLKGVNESFSGCDSGIAQKIEIEGKLLQKFNHPSIPRLTDFYYHQDNKNIPILVMEEVSGKPLYARLGRLSTKDLSRTAKAVASVIDYTYLAHDVSNGDIWPGNVLISDEHVNVVDYGNTNFTPRAYVVTTPYFSAPEFCQTKTATRSADIYSLGVTMYAAMLSHSPFMYERGIHGEDPDPFKRKYRVITDEELARVNIPTHAKQPLNDLFLSIFSNDLSIRPSRAIDFATSFTEKIS